MSSSSTLRAIVLPLMVSCAVVGGYGAMVMGAKNGFFDAITNSTTRPGNPYIPGGVHPLKTTYTGIPAIDHQLLNLVAFFASIVDTEQTWGITASYWYGMTQYFAACCLLFLESLRKGNSWRAVSWSGTMGMIAQNISYTITVPFYLILHILTSPTASQTASSGDVLPLSPLEPALLLWSMFLAFGVPAIAMSLPAPSVVSAATHYNLLAIWQAFPLWYSLFQWMYSSLTSSSKPPVIPTNRSSVSSAVVYRLVLFLAVASHLTLLFLCLTPSSVIPVGWPTLSAVFDQVTFYTALIPRSLASPPSVNPKLSPIPADAMAPLAQYFLQYDIYCGSAAVMLWAVYLRRVAARNTDRFSWTSLVAKVLGLGAVGGPVAVAALLLWERDELLLKRDGAVGKKRL